MLEQNIKLDFERLCALTKILETDTGLKLKGVYLGFVAAQETQIQEALELYSARLQNAGDLDRQKLQSYISRLSRILIRPREK